ncbi:innate immunity activator protein [Syngnathoides biaculeatus]|uniref:innate immunity activator protein n=1 Tax=Syngnathoides biaculeatus TaxID=300417 RepID=UPI002ADE1909|nr:innate immunity activator protein [Syngnathoides biaculeatus]XP_061661088.1 innate immunity activator protein [Syngnathoides biaculeatus]XP_061661096.1 innate immunity activator protein [Syngnathoides biaculeatus]XP_061661104.1 innate immunity activator protein [Syngnathoides biaculeatus]
MTAIETKEEISDTDSGIILHSGPESPTLPMKDPSTHTRVLKLKHQSLEGHLELCLLELRKLCIREAELTGKLSSDYPLMPDENLPQVRRRIGASFKLDEGLIYLDNKDSELHGLETELALQRQIYKAARKLSLEEKLSKPQKKKRVQQCEREEKKVRELQEAIFQCRIRKECSSPCSSNRITKSKDEDLNMSDDSSLSDVVRLDEDVDSIDLVSAPMPDVQTFIVNYERSPIQNSPWKESSLDQPYQKAAKPQPVASSSSSTTGRMKASADTNRIPLSQFIKTAAPRYNHSASTPSTPVLHVRRQSSQSFRFPKSRPRADKESLSSESFRVHHCATDIMVLSSESSSLHPDQSSSEDSSSEHSASSYTALQDTPTEIPKLCPPPYGIHLAAPKKELPGFSPINSPPHTPQHKHMVARCSRQQRPWQDGPASARRTPKLLPPYTRVLRTPSLKEYTNHAVRIIPREVVSEELKTWHQRNQSVPSCVELQRPLGVKRTTLLHMPPFNQGSGNFVLQRDADGTPVQWFVEEDHEIVSQV